MLLVEEGFERCVSFRMMSGVERSQGGDSGNISGRRGFLENRENWGKEA